MNDIKLFMVLVGCKPAGRHTEQHDVFFGIAGCLKDLVSVMREWWPEAKGRIHIDAWREVKHVGGYAVRIIKREYDTTLNSGGVKLFFLNLGGYKQNEFEEFHYKMLVACDSKDNAVRLAKSTAFYKHTGFKGAPSHVDDKYGIDVDDIYQIEELLPLAIRENFQIIFERDEQGKTDEMHLGYLTIEKLQKKV